MILTVNTLLIVLGTHSIIPVDFRRYIVVCNIQKPIIDAISEAFFTFDTHVIYFLSIEGQKKII